MNSQQTFLNSAVKTAHDDEDSISSNSSTNTQVCLNFLENIESKLEQKPLNTTQKKAAVRDTVRWRLRKVKQKSEYGKLLVMMPLRKTIKKKPTLNVIS